MPAPLHLPSTGSLKSFSHLVMEKGISCFYLFTSEAGDISQRKKYHMIPLKCGIWKNRTEMDSDIENKRGCQRGWGGGGHNRWRGLRGTDFSYTVHTCKPQGCNTQHREYSQWYRNTFVKWHNDYLLWWSFRKGYKCWITVLYTWTYTILYTNYISILF